MTDLSPAAQTVLDQAIYKGPELEKRVAAALRTVADQVDWNWEPCSQLLAIAAELEGHGQA